MIDRTPKLCHHKQAQHQHGDYVTYVLDRCRCLPCAFAYSEYDQWRRDRKAVNRPNLVPFDRACEHIERLRDSGWPMEVIAKRTGLSAWTIKRLSLRQGALIQPATERRILAFAGESEDRAFLVDATGARRRIEALMAIGWSLLELSQRAGFSDHTLNLILKPGSRCRIPTRETIKILYDEIWDQPPSDNLPYSLMVKSRMLNVARRRGYAPPLAWDDETIDDPNAYPNVDGVSDDADRMGLYLAGLSDVRMAREEGISPESIAKWRRRRGLPSNYKPRGMYAS